MGVESFLNKYLEARKHKIKLRHIIKRIAEQPGILKAIMHNISPSCDLYALKSQELLGQKPRTLIDVGANRGEVISAFIFRFPGIKVYAFEPLKEHHALLKKFQNTKLYPIGLWNKNEKKKFYVCKHNDGESSFLKPIYYDGEERELELKRFDSLDIKIERPCVLKIDVEGAEDRVLEGFGDSLKDIDIVQIEQLYGKRYEGKAGVGKIMNLLEKYDFDGFVQVSMTYYGKIPDKSDLIFFKDFWKNPQINRFKQKISKQREKFKS